MNTRKLLTLLVFIALVLSTCGMEAAPLQKVGFRIEAGAPFPTARTMHTLTQLPNGKILIVGGSSAPDVHLSSVDIYNPVNRTYAPTGSLHTARHGHTATLLQDGRVLVVGGYSLPQQWLSDAEIYDPSTGQWEQSYPPHHHGTVHTATLMNDGRVLVVGGCIGSYVCTNQVDIFDPQTDSWIAGPALTADRSSHTAQLLQNGKVLVAGGTGAWGETPADGHAMLYDPILNEWSPTGPMVSPRHLAQSTLLPDGRVLVIGGILLGEPTNTWVTTSSEIYDPESNTWTVSGSMAEKRFGFSVATLQNGWVVVMGGTRVWDCCWTETSFVREVEAYDATADTWTTIGTLRQAGSFSSAVLLSNHQIWLTGGQSNVISYSKTWLISVRRMRNPDSPRHMPRSQSTVEILLDDFRPQPYWGQSEYFYNRMEGDRGALNNSIMDWNEGQAQMTISPGRTWGGLWMSLNHPIREELPINFSAILPTAIHPKYQSRITAVNLSIAAGTPGQTLKVELKNVDEVQWQRRITLTGERQQVTFALPSVGHVNHFVLVLDQAQPGDSVTVERVSFAATNPIVDTPTAAFVWSYGMLLNNWDPASGLVRDKAKDAANEFDAIQATGSLAAATAVANQLGVVNHEDAVLIVNKITDTILHDIPRYHGLLPHWVKEDASGEFVILDHTEWSSVDTVIAVIALLESQSSLGLDTSETEQLLMNIDWEDLHTPDGISHGYTSSGQLIPYAWDAFGGESWLMQWAHASATGDVADQKFVSPPTANGSGFIDELAWLFAPPPATTDYWGTNWAVYRQSAATEQIDYYASFRSPNCFSAQGLFGLSAAEVPDPSAVPQERIYQAFGIGGAFAGANDGSQTGALVITPHYAAMIASLRPADASRLWRWLVWHGYFSPLHNIESLAFPPGSNCDPRKAEWNQLKGSWNLALQTLGWGRYLAERDGRTPILWQAAESNSTLKAGYEIVAHPSSTLTAQGTVFQPFSSFPQVHSEEMQSVQ